MLTKWSAPSEDIVMRVTALRASSFSKSDAQHPSKFIYQQMSGCWPAPARREKNGRGGNRERHNQRRTEWRGKSEKFLYVLSNEWAHFYCYTHSEISSHCELNNSCIKKRDDILLVLAINIKYQYFIHIFGKGFCISKCTAILATKIPTIFHGN